MLGKRFLVNSISSASLSNAGTYKEYKDIKTDVKNGNLKKGSLIDIFRCENNGIPYSHWVIFEKEDLRGNLWCFHVSGVEGGHNGEEIVSGGRAQIKYEPLAKIIKDNFSGTESLCRINDQTNMAKEMLKITNNNMPVIEDVFSMLHQLKGSIVKYDIKRSNCEHYVTLWKYGIGWSSQVDGVKDIITKTFEIMSDGFIIAGKSYFSTQDYATGGLCILFSAISSQAMKITKDIEIIMHEMLIIEAPKENKNKDKIFWILLIIIILILCLLCGLLLY